MVGKFSSILEEARRDFEAGMNWVDYSNKYFSQNSRFLPADKAEFNEYLNSPEFEEVQNMKFELEKRQADPAESFSGKFVVRVPKSLHKSLVEEAEREGVSLNQLCLAKLARPL